MVLANTNRDKENSIPGHFCVTLCTQGQDERVLRSVGASKRNYIFMFTSQAIFTVIFVWQ